MSYSETQSFGNGGQAVSRSRDSTPVAVQVRRIRLALGIGMVLLLVALVVLGQRSASDLATADDTVSQTVTESEAGFDNRGKWGGYAR